MKIIVNGGGPSGLYFALLARKHLGAEVTVYEQNPRDATYGFGIVLADHGLNRFKAADEASYRMIMSACFISRHRVLTHKDETIFIEGGGYGAAISRLRLLDILQRSCEAAGVSIVFGRRIKPGDPLDGDLVVGADGVNSIIRDAQAGAFGVSRYSLTNRLAWYGTQAPFPYPILSFRKNDQGYFWCVGYSYTESMSTFVAECDEGSWQCALAHLNDDERTAYVEKVFADDLRGHRLVSNKSTWHALPVIRVKNWSVGNRVLIGDALHSAHPSIGSGTRIAMEDALALVESLEAHGEISGALDLFRRRREPTKEKLVDAAEKSFNWYETIVHRLDELDAPTLVFDFMTRTGRIDRERLEHEFPEFINRFESQWKGFTAA